METRSEPSSQTPKQELQSIMFEAFAIIEALDIQEGKYLELANLFRDMNINLNRLGELRNIIIQNTYYQRQQNPNTTLRRKRLTEAEKAKHSDYALCNCGRYFKFFQNGQQPKRHKEHLITHLHSLVHHQGLRNRKYSKRPNTTKEEIDEFINREVVLQGFIINHLSTLHRGNRTQDEYIDDEGEDEVVSV